MANSEYQEKLADGKFKTVQAIFNVDSNKVLDGVQEDNEFLRKARGEIKDEKSFREKERFVAEGLDEKRKGPIAAIWDKVQALWNYVRSEDVPWTKKVLPLAGLVYLVSPIDLVPDFIPVAGLVDDAGVLGFIVYQMGSLLTSFAIASAIIALLTSDLIFKWIDRQRTQFPDADTAELIREKLANGNYRVECGIFKDGGQVASQTWESKELDEGLTAEFGGKKKVVYDLT